MSRLRQISQRTFLEVIAETAQLTGVEAADIIGRRRFRHMVRARQRAMWSLHRRGYGYTAIGRRWGMTHWTIMQGIEVIERLDTAGAA
jgi:chromosomal replication initiation ATPase DnaA